MCLRWIDEKSAIVISKCSGVLVFVVLHWAARDGSLLIEAVQFWCVFISLHAQIIPDECGSFQFLIIFTVVVHTSPSRPRPHDELIFYWVNKAFCEDDVTGDESTVLHKKKRKGRNYTRGFFFYFRAHNVSGRDTFQSIRKRIYVRMRILFLRMCHARSSPLIAVQLKHECQIRRSRHAQRRSVQIMPHLFGP